LVAESSSPRRAAWLAAAGLAAVVIGWPVARLFGVALERGIGTLIATLTGPQATVAIWSSLWTGGLIALLAVTAGTTAALLTERSALPGRRWLRAGLLLPLLVPPFVTAFGWARAFGPRGLTDQVLGLALPGIYGPLGIVVVLSVAATPLAYLIVAGALASRVEPDLERAARASGATRFEALWTITLPLLRPALLSALVVVFVYAINAFGVPAVLGTPAGFATITTRLYQDLALSADPAAFVRATTMAASLVVVALVVVGSSDALFVGRGAARTALPAGAGLPRSRRAVAVALGTAIALATVLPLVALVLAALTRATGLQPVPANWTLDNFAAALDGRFLGGLAHSVVLALAAATATLVLGALAVAAGRRRSRLLGTAITLGFAVPGSALAVAVLLAYGGWLRDTLAIILVAYVAKFWALGHRQLAGSVERLPGDLVRAARASGAGPLDAFRSVVVPALRPSIIAAWLVVFVFALHELTMSSLLYGPGNATLAVIVLNVQQLGDPTITAAMAVLLVGVVALAAIPLAIAGFGGETASRRGGAAS
jgi:iron(III) transport system permease protein